MLLLRFFAYQQEPTKRWQYRPLTELPIRTMSHAEGVYTQPRGNFAEIVRPPLPAHDSTVSEDMQRLA
jgi:hypothetical protein